ncbi:MAG: PTS sugar transporter subunit IIC/EAL domain-containing protein [Xanthomonadales bacterium]|nr:PTS sugar transporter subunit IIC/EAL domain-containing protein [Xanthomonadales bacterium]
MKSTGMFHAASEWRPLVAIRSGYATLLPLILLQGIDIAIVAGVDLFIPAEQWRSMRDLLFYVHTFVLSLLPALAVCTISYHAANLYGSNRPFAVALSLFVFLLLTLTLDRESPRRIDELSLLGNVYSLFVGPIVPWALSRLERISILQLFRSPHQNAYVRRFLNYVLPTVMIVAVAVVLDGAIQATDWSSLVAILHRDGWANHFPSLVVYVVVLNALWTLGIHGSLALMPWVRDLMMNFSENAAVTAAGGVAPNLFPSPAFSAFVNLGGSGTALALAIAIFLVARSRTKRLICASAMPVLCFNVNELLIYGLPVIFNRYLMPPFVIAPLACTSVAYFAISAGIVPIPTQYPGWTTPPLLGAWLATGGSWAAVGLAAFNLVIAIAIYVPFVRRWEAAQSAIGDSVMEFRDRFRFGSSTPVTHVESDTLGAAEPRDDSDLAHALRLMREGSLVSYYQPIVGVAHGRIVGVESLLRLNHRVEGILAPHFLGALKRANLAGEIDGWVVENLVAEWSAWDIERVTPPLIHVNVHPRSLLSMPLVERIIEAGRVLPINVEIIEDELPDPIDDFKTSIALLQRNDIHLAIDDFGVGYSSLSRLADLGITQLKIDKSMLDAAFGSARAKQLLSGIIEFAKKLEMTVCVEGVERIEQLRFLRLCGVDEAQGYLIGKPMPWAAMRALVEAGRPLLDVADVDGADAAGRPRA